MEAAAPRPSRTRTGAPHAEVWPAPISSASIKSARLRSCCATAKPAKEEPATSAPVEAAATNLVRRGVGHAQRREGLRGRHGDGDGARDGNLKAEGPQSLDDAAANLQRALERGRLSDRLDRVRRREPLPVRENRPADFAVPGH